MSIKIGDYNFDGPFDSTSDLRHKSGVYAILGRDSEDKKWQVVDIGESKDVKDRVENHDREDCWEAQDYEILGYAAYFCTKSRREIIETILRRKYNPPCGDR